MMQLAYHHPANHQNHGVLVVALQLELQKRISTAPFLDGVILSGGRFSGGAKDLASRPIKAATLKNSR